MFDGDLSETKDEALKKYQERMVRRQNQVMAESLKKINFNRDLLS